MMKYLLALALLFPVLSPAQSDRGNDSLIKLLSNSREDTNKANVLTQLCRNYMNSDGTLFALRTSELMTLSNKINWAKGKADAYNFLGIMEDDKTNYSKALDLYATAMVYAKQSGLELKTASIKNNIGLIYWKIGDQQKALGFYYDALRIFERIGEKKRQANVLSNIGLIHSSLKDEKKALEFQRRALALRIETKDDYGLASTYNNIAKSFTLESEEDSSMYYTRLAIAIQEKTGDDYGLGISLGNLGHSYGNIGLQDSALFYLNKSLLYRERAGDKLGMIFNYHVISELCRVSHKYALAIQSGEKALAIAREIDSRERISTVMRTLGQIYAETGNHKKAYEYLQVHDRYQVEMYDTFKNRQVAELAVKYEVGKKDLLIQKDKAELKNRQSEIANQQLKLSQRNTQLSLLAILLLGTGMTSYLFYNRYRLRQEGRLQQEIIKQQDIASRAIIEAEERERKRIAGDLHDGLGQLCSAIKMNLSSLEKQVAFNDKDAVLSFEKTVAMTDQACKDVRTISHRMMPNVLLKFGLATAVRDFLDKIDARRLQIHLDTFGLRERLDSNTETVLYRVIQETVNNVIRHSGADTLYIVLNKDEEGITATIEDNGTGFEVREMENFKGIGLRNIASRIEFLKGTVEFDSAKGRGTVVSVWVPSQ